jgi:hypothetical protein
MELLEIQCSCCKWSDGVMYWSQLFWGWHLQLVFSEGNVVQNTTACAESTWFRSSDADESVWAGVDAIHKRTINGSRRWSGPWHCGFFSSHGWKSAPDAAAPRNRFVSTLNLIFLGVHWLSGGCNLHSNLSVSDGDLIRRMLLNCLQLLL